MDDELCASTAAHEQSLRPNRDIVLLDCAACWPGSGAGCIEGDLRVSPAYNCTVHFSGEQCVVALQLYTFDEYHQRHACRVDAGAYLPAVPVKGSGNCERAFGIALGVCRERAWRGCG